MFLIQFATVKIGLVVTTTYSNFKLATPRYNIYIWQNENLTAMVIYTTNYTWHDMTVHRHAGLEFLKKLKSKF